MMGTDNYTLNGLEIFPHKGIFDFDTESTIDENDLTLTRLARDIADSLYGSSNIMSEENLDIIYKNFLNNSNGNVINSYRLVCQIERTLGVNLRVFFDKGSSQQKIDTLKLLKLLYGLIKKDTKSRVITLLEKPSLDNIQSNYYEYPFFTEIQEMKSIIDFLSPKRQGTDFQEIYPLVDTFFALNEAVFRNKVLCNLYNGNTDKIIRLNNKMSQLINDEPKDSGDAEDFSLKINKTLNDVSDLDVLQVFSFALDKYYLKCLNNSYLNSLEDLISFFKSPYFNDKLRNRSEEQKMINVLKGATVDEIVTDMLNDENYLMLITKDSAVSPDDNIVNYVRQDAKYVLKNYNTLNWEEREEDFEVLENSHKPSMCLAVLQMLYICRKENLHYKTDSIGDKVTEYSLKEVFAKWNPEKAISPEEIYATRIWQERKNAKIIDVSIEGANNPASNSKSGETNWLRNKGKEYLLGKMFPQLIYARNILSEDKFNIYIQFLKNYHEMQNKLCESILCTEFSENCNKFFEWICKNIDKEDNEEDQDEYDDEEDENNDEDDEYKKIYEFYALFRKNFLENRMDVLNAFKEKNPDYGDEIIEYMEEVFINKDIESLCQGLKSLLPDRCKTEFKVLKDLFMYKSRAVSKMLTNYCEDYEDEALYFVKELFNKLSAEKYKTLKKLLRQNERINYSGIKADLEECDELSVMKDIFPQIGENEYKIIKECIKNINKYEFSLLSKLIYKE